VPFEDADAVPVALTWLRGHERVLEAFGGPDHISGVRRAPWPHLRVTPAPGGDLRDLLYEQAQEVTLEVYGDPDGSVPEPTLRRLTMLAVRALAEMPERRPYDGVTPVVSLVTVSVVPFGQVLANKQVRWSATVNVVLRPAAP
jgi:hypothetical protein